MAMNSKLRVVLQIVVALLVVSAYGYAVMESGYTLVAPVPVWIAVSAVALILSVLAWRIWVPLTDSCNKVVNILVGALVSAGILAAAFYGLNAAFPSEVYSEKGVVVRKYRKEHHRTKRIGRRSYGRGEKYYTYHVDVITRSGTPFEWEISLEKYNRVREGYNATCEVENGLFGIMCVVPSSLHISKPEPEYREPRYRNMHGRGDVSGKPH